MLFFFRNPLSSNYQLDLGDDGDAARNQPSHSVFWKPWGWNQADFGEDSAENFKRLGWLGKRCKRETQIHRLTHPGLFHIGNPVGVVGDGGCTWCFSNSLGRPEAFDTSKWVPQNEWFTMENPIKMAELGGTPILGRPYLFLFQQLQQTEEFDIIWHNLTSILTSCWWWPSLVDAAKTIQSSGPTLGHYEFCRGGQQEKWWDGDILYRADLFELEEDSVMDWGSNRGASGIGWSRCEAQWFAIM